MADIISDLGGGLVLRKGTAADGDALLDFYAQIFCNRETKVPNRYVGTWARDLASLPHPTFHEGGYTIVEETATGRIISALNLIPQTWTYESVPFKMGRPELVGSIEEYRERGLIRAQFEEIHRWSAARGDLLQAITGIPYFYRLFGYEMALNLGGGRGGPKETVPALKEGESESFLFRTATEADVPLMMELWRARDQRNMIGVERDGAMWRYELGGRSAESCNRVEILTITTSAGVPTGMLMHPANMEGTTINATALEIKPGISWAAVLPSVLRYLQTKGTEISARNNKEFRNIHFSLGAEHPVYSLVENRLPRYNAPYAWYIRIPDMAAFLRQIAPALERRLERSVMAGHTGELKISFYRGGVRLAFENGSITTVEPLQGRTWDWSTASARFPNLTFNQLVMGYRSTSELGFAFADCWPGNDDNKALLDILFPKRASDLWPVS